VHELALGATLAGVQVVELATHLVTLIKRGVGLHNTAEKMTHFKNITNYKG
jgi:hypothetical protein